MKEFKEIFTSITQFAKEDPKEFFVSIITIIVIFAFLYFSLWTVHIIQG